MIYNSDFELKIRELKKMFMNIFKTQNIKYIKRQRKLKMEDLFHFLCYQISNNLSLNRANYDFHLDNLKTSSKVNVSNTAYLKKLHKWDIKDIDNISITLKNHIYKDIIKRRFLSCDGSDLNFIKTVIENSLKDLSLSPSKLYKKGNLSSLIDVDTKVVVSLKTFTSANERENFLEQMKYITTNDVIIYDAGYYARYVLDKLIDKNIGFMFRLPKNNDFIKQLPKNGGDKSEAIFTIPKTTYKVRIVHYKHTASNELCKKKPNLENKEDYFILTSLIDTNEFKIEDIKNIYHKRWNVETLFRQIKYISGFSRVDFKSTATFEKMLSIIEIVYSFTAYIEDLIKTHNKLSSSKKINKKISLKSVSFDLLGILLKNKLTKTKMEFIFNMFKLFEKFCMPVQKDRHYRRVTKRPINGWSNMGSIFKK